MTTTHSDFTNIPVVVLCGGRLVSLGETGATPSSKALLRVRERPLFWWVLRHYIRYGARQFLLATGLQGERYADVLTGLGAQARGAEPGQFVLPIAGEECHVRLVPSGPDASTAARLLACKTFLQDQSCFALTYSDTLSDVDLGALLRFHQAQHRVASFVAVRPPMRFRILGIRQGECLVRAFARRPIVENTQILGGYFLFGAELWSPAYGLNPEVALENQPLEALATAAQLVAFEHRGLWQYCDAQRDLETLEGMAAHFE